MYSHPQIPKTQVFQSQRAKNVVTAQAEYRRLFKTEHAAIDFEAFVLSLDIRHLPKCIQIVLDGRDPTPEYWKTLKNVYKELHNK